MRLNYFAELFSKYSGLILMAMITIGCTSTAIKSNAYHALHDYQCMRETQYPSQCDQKNYENYNHDVESLERD